MRSKDGFWNKKYHFETLDIGEHLYIEGGRLKNIRTACSDWGRRYGIWLRATEEGKTKSNKPRFLVTRLTCQPVRKYITREKKFEKQVDEVKQGLKDQKDALRALTLLVLNCKNLLEEITGNQLPKEKIVYDPYENRT